MAGVAMRARFFAGFCGLLLALVPVAGPARDVDATALAEKWTNTDPPINLVHIDFGEINRHGEAVGFHHRMRGADPDGARVLQIVQPSDANGVYRARVAIRDPATGTWLPKKAPSTFFPDSMSDTDVVAAILAAFRASQRHGNGQFVGASGRGFMLEGWYQNGRINAAYPLRGP
jgi:Bacterial EndoU nuclease